MNSNNMLDIIGETPEKYVLEAMNINPKAISISSRSFKKIWLIAAIVALMLLLAGYVVFFLGLQDLSLGKFSLEMQNGETVSIDRISLQGYAGTPEYMAGREWLEFIESYDQDQTLINLAAYDDYVEPIEYRVYGCYTREMVDKVDEILKKYNLKMPKRCYSDVDPQEIYDAVGINGIFSPDMTADAILDSGMYYDDGSFHTSGNLTLNKEPGTPASFEYFCLKKNTLFDFFGSIHNIEIYDQWQFTTQNGDEVLLAASDTDARIFVNKSDCFITVHFMHTMDKQALEAAADCFDFFYTLQPVDMEAADLREAERQAEFDSNYKQMQALSKYESYSEFFENYINTEQGFFYSLLDANGDGFDEVAYYFNDSYQELFTIQDGYVQKIQSGVSAFANGYFICRTENGEYVFETAKQVGKQNHVSYLSADGLDLKYVAYLKYDAESGTSNPWFVCTNAEGNTVQNFSEMPMHWQPVNAVEFSGIRDSYPVQYLPLYPISNLISPPEETYGAVTEELIVGKSTIDNVVEYYQTVYSDKQLKSYLHDFDGNNYGDLAVWYDGKFRALYMMDEGYILKQEYVFENGFEMYETYWQGVNQVNYEGNLIGIVEEQYGVTYTKFLRIGNELSMREYLKFDPNGTESQWFSAAIESWDVPYNAVIDDWTPITEAEYQEKITEYQIQAYNLKHISEYYYR